MESKHFPLVTVMKGVSLLLVQTITGLWQKKKLKGRFDERGRWVFNFLNLYARKIATDPLFERASETQKGILSVCSSLLFGPLAS